LITLFGPGFGGSVFGRAVGGRPVVSTPDNRKLAITISYSEHSCVVAVAEGRQVGIDLEAISRAPIALETAGATLTPEERAHLDGLPDVARPERALELWALKEAYLKARGIGLALPPDAFGFDLCAETIELRCDARAGDEAARWRFELPSIDADHVVACAVERLDGDTPDIVVTALSPA
jgi:4'-phosphopantetheinyl transferase